MIITCAECSTSFKLDGSLLSEKGSKVSCSVCDTIFIAYPTPQQPADSANTEPSTDFSQRVSTTGMPAGELNIDLGPLDESLIFLEEPELRIEEMSFEDDFNIPDLPDPSEFNDSISPPDQSSQSDQPSLEPIVEEDGFSLELGDDDGIEEEISFSLEQEIIDENVEPVAELMLEEETQSLEDIDELSEDSIEIDDEFQFNDSLTEIEPDPEPEISPPPLPPKRQSLDIRDHMPADYNASGENGLFGLSINKPLLVGVSAIILIICIGVASVMTGFKIPYVSEFLTPEPPVEAPLSILPVEDSVNGRFVANSQGSHYFIISGKIINDSKQTVSHILVKAILTTAGNKTIQTKTVYSGNTITDEAISKEPIAKIDQILMKKQDTDIEKVLPGKTITFTAAFANLPDDLEGYSVEVLTFDKE